MGDSVLPWVSTRQGLLKYCFLKADTRNVFFILSPKILFRHSLCLIKLSAILQRLLKIYFHFCFVYIFGRLSEKQARRIFNPSGVIWNRCDNFFFTY